MGLSSVLILGGCGRLGFPVLAGDGDAGPVDAGAPGDAAATDGRPGEMPLDASDGEDAAGGEPDAAMPVDAGEVSLPEYCDAVPALAAAPSIDGVLEAGLSLRGLSPPNDGFINPPDSMVSSGHAIAYAVAFRPNGLYFFVRVSDPSRVPAPPVENAWCGDSVELYVDSDGAFANPPWYDPDGTRQFIVRAPTDDVTSARTATAHWRTGQNQYNQSTWTSEDYVAVPTSDGYVVEAFVQAVDLGIASWQLAPDGRIGLNLAVNFSPDSLQMPYCFANRAFQVLLRILPDLPDAEGYPHQNTAAFCTPIMGSD